MTLPSFSAIIPTFDRSRTIERAIDSILAQRHPAGEIIVVDDGSSDGTADLVRRRFPDVRLIRHDANRGQATARNTAISIARHDHLAFLDSDDAWHEDYLLVIGEAWRDNPDAAIVYTQYDKIEDWAGGRSEPVEPEAEGDQIEAMLLNNFIHSSSLVSTRRDWTIAVGGFDPAYHISEDRVLYLRLLLRGPAVLVRRRLVRRYVGDDNLIHNIEGWWEDSMTIVARFIAQPDFAAYRWVEDQARARTWQVIQWHDQQVQRTSRTRAQAERGARKNAAGGSESAVAAPATAILGSMPEDAKGVYLFVHAGGLPIQQIATLLTDTGLVGRPEPWFDHDGPMLDKAAALDTDDVEAYIGALLSEAPCSALISYRDLAWVDREPAFQELLRRTETRTFRLRCRDIVLQAYRRLTGQGDRSEHPRAPTFEALTAAIIGLGEAEAFGDDWLARRRISPIVLWQEDFVDPSLPAVGGLRSSLGLPGGEGIGVLRPITLPGADEMAIVRSFRAEAKRRCWTHALLPAEGLSSERSRRAG